MNGGTEEEAATLLAAQLADLARYRHILEAQRAVLRMEDAGLIDHFTAEAEAIVSNITARDSQLLSVRVAAQAEAARGPRATRLADLHARVQQERANAGNEAQILANEIARATLPVTEAIKRSSQQLQTVFRGYGQSSQLGVPTLIDRRG